MYVPTPAWARIGPAVFVNKIKKIELRFSTSGPVTHTYAAYYSSEAKSEKHRNANKRISICASVELFAFMYFLKLNMLCKLAEWSHILQGANLVGALFTLRDRLPTIHRQFGKLRSQHSQANPK